MSSAPHSFLIWPVRTTTVFSKPDQSRVRGVLSAGHSAPCGVLVALSVTACAIWHLGWPWSSQSPVPGSPTGPRAQGYAARAGWQAMPTLPGHSGSLATASVARVQPPT